MLAKVNMLKSKLIFKWNNILNQEFNPYTDVASFLDQCYNIFKKKRAHMSIKLFAFLSIIPILSHLLFPTKLWAGNTILFPIRWRNKIVIYQLIVEKGQNVCLDIQPCVFFIHELNLDTLNISNSIMLLRKVMCTHRRPNITILISFNIIIRAPFQQIVLKNQFLLNCYSHFTKI